MPEPITVAVVTVLSQVAGPALNGLAEVTRALKEPMGRKGVEELRAELSTVCENLERVIVATQADIETLRVRTERMQRQLDFYRLPFWKRLFKRVPE